MNKNRTSFLSVGIPSMCTIFSVLCLVILALLTLNTSEQDLQTSRIALEQTTAYYTACSAASSKYQELTAYAQQPFTDGQNNRLIIPLCRLSHNNIRMPDGIPKHRFYPSL